MAKFPQATQRPWAATFNKRLGHWTIHHTQMCDKGESSIIFTIHTSLNEQQDAQNAALIVAAVNAYQEE